MTAFAWASITGSISGVISDPTGAVISGAVVKAVNTQTGIATTVKTDNKGFYNMPALPIGTYNVEVTQTGFRTYQKNGLVIDANSAIREDATLPLGTTSEKVEVQSDAVHVETESTQMGEVITGQKMTAVPLNGRDFTDLLALQPGVVPSAYAAQAPGLNDRSVSGSDRLNAGNQSVNGQREAANGFMVNGSSVQEGKNNGASVIPNLDSIAEFRIITNNFDAEYGNFSGGQINVATKSGTNSYHGSAFEFLRNTALDAKNYFDAPGTATPKFIQNQFGGTFGGPIRRNKTFFFVDYQGTRQVQAPTQNFEVPSVQDRSGNVLDLFSSTAASGNSIGSVNSGTGPGSWASVLSQRLGYTVQPGEAYWAPGCTSNDAATGCVFPNGVIPQAAWSSAATQLLQFIPSPTLGNLFVTSALSRTRRDDKGGVRIDQSTRFGMLFAYYFMDDYTVDDPYPNGGATVPGFNALSVGRAQLINLGDTKSFGSYAVNEFRFSFVRNAQHLFQPSGGLHRTLASLGFVEGWNATTGGISPINPAYEGVPNITFNNFSIGVPSDTVQQFNNSFQWLDNFSKVVGTHTLRFGGQFRYDQINERNYFGENGSFGFSGSETGVDFADFLLGAPDSVIQASKQILDSRSKYGALYFQDSWRARPTFVLNYGLRWEVSTPWYDTQNKIETIIPGVQSVLFPGAPQGWVVPGDPGVPRTLAPIKWNAFSPRLGMAWSPSSDNGILGKILGGPGKTSIRAGFGLYYTAVEDLSQFLEVGDPPYGLFYVSGVSPRLEAPYIDRATGNSQGQRFPFNYPPLNVSAKNPDNNFNWAQVEPISSGFVFYHKNRLPYSEHYEFSLQRQLGANTVITTSYVGNQGHKLITSIDANPSNPALCLSLINAEPACGPFSEDPRTGFKRPDGTFVAAVRPLGPRFGSNPYMAEIAHSSYNSLQVNANHSTGRLNLLVGYTYSKCMDNASGLQDSTYPFDPRRSIGLCAFDVTHNFVTSYNVLLPFDKLTNSGGWKKKLAQGWTLSGITTFATGLPVSLSENDDNSLIGVTSAPVDVPNFSGGHVLDDTNPRHGNPYFNPALFSQELLGQFGNSRRRFFHGPGINNFDIALLKSTKLTESKELQVRFEAFNAFNHAQFQNPTGEINSSQFGVVTSALDPRIMQVAMKLIF
ncbi:MAG TPA: carboxypeptidase regulatory-like domain-containing protein [Terriglobales bacterium]|nr:carboxypeptidase regulatory-like domain-containing protein [Terriglobales bacterium]